MQRNECTPELTVRRYRPADAEQLRAVRERAVQATDAYVEGANEDLSDLETAAMATDSGTEILVATSEGSVVAAGAIRPLPDDAADAYQALLEPAAELCQVWVDPDFQRRGFGTRICAELERRARDAGYRELTLDTDLHNHDAQAFCRRLGFARATTITVEVDAGEFGLALYRKSLVG